MMKSHQKNHQQGLWFNMVSPTNSNPIVMFTLRHNFTWVINTWLSIILIHITDIAWFKMVSNDQIPISGHLLHRLRGAQRLPAPLGLPAPERHCARANGGELGNPWSFRQVALEMIQWFNMNFQGFSNGFSAGFLVVLGFSNGCPMVFLLIFHWATDFRWRFHEV